MSVVVWECRGMQLVLGVSGWCHPPCPVPAELPGAPTNLGISNIGPRSVTLQFRPGYDGKTSISRWQVEAQVWDGYGVAKGVPGGGSPHCLPAGGPEW